MSRQPSGRAAADAAAQLMQLREAETLGVLDDHDRRLRHVDADLDDGRRDQDLVSPRWKRSIAASFSGPAIRPCTVRRRRRKARARPRRDPRPRRRRASRSPRPAGRSSRRARPRERPGQSRDHLLEPFDRQGAGVDRLPAGRLFAQGRDVHVAEIGEHQRARNGRRGHHQKIDASPLAASARRCRTPKRCCSSTTARPRSAKTTLS